MIRQKDSSLNQLDDKVLVTIRENRLSTIFGYKQKSFYVPKESNINYLRLYMMNKSLLHSQSSMFLFAYGNILNNNDTMETLQQRFKHQINPQKGIEVQFAEMASF